MQNETFSKLQLLSFLISFFILSGGVQEDVVWIVFLPRTCTRTPKVRSTWLEHRVRVQRNGFTYQCSTVEHVHEQLRGML